MSDTTQTNETETDLEAVSNLTITDLVVMRNIIDLASTRGAFKGEDLTVVGDVYNKLSSFIEKIASALKTDEVEGASEKQSDTTE